ncbi:MAG: hypothetical protein OXE93_00405 [bacterium]|nr:hypothetical protein [bacterium]MCY4162672.1 hypothetical protein [bacterium]MCY4258328.1 hypothetical protein [bacterium]
MTSSTLQLQTPRIVPSLWIEPWQDSITEQSGHDPRSRYVEQYWLSVIGPTAAWLMRYVAHQFDRYPDGFELSVAEIAMQLGVSPKAGNRSGLLRSFERLVLFRLAAQAHAGFAVRRSLPTLNSAQIRRLPQHLKRSHVEHEYQQKSQTAA